MGAHGARLGQWIEEQGPCRGGDRWEPVSTGLWAKALCARIKGWGWGGWGGLQGSCKLRDPCCWGWGCLSRLWELPSRG